MEMIAEMHTKPELYSLIKKISENLFITRPKREVVYRPCIKNDAVSRKILSEISVDLRNIYPDAKIGDYAFVTTRIITSRSSEVILKVSGNPKIYLNENELSADENCNVRINVKTGDILKFKCTANENSFGVGFTLSTVFYPGMWACDYLLWVRATMPVESFYGEDGVAVSKLNGEEIAMPATKRHDGIIDFAKVYDTGKFAFALTYAMVDTFYTGDGEAFVNGKKYDGSVIKKGSTVLVRVKRDESFTLNTGDDKDFGIPFIETSRPNGTAWLLCGGTDDEALPEVQFTKPFNNQFWRFEDGSYLRPYLDTHFYGQWFYALMVGQYGILKAADVCGDAMKQYFTDGMNILAKYFEYMRYDAAVFGSPSFLQRSIKLADLDSIGTIGMNLCELYSIEKKKEIKIVADALYSALENNIPRFEDGTFHRETTMWSDDTFMSLPFLARLGKITNDTKFFDECKTQIDGFFKRLYMENEKLFSHIYFLKDNKPNNVPWGRGNGWVFLALTEVLERLPEDYGSKKDIIKKYQNFAEGIIKSQDRSGMWHQVLNMPSSYEETSCTGMFALGLLRGVKNGWLSEACIENVERAVRAIEHKSIDKDGNIIGVCRGSECSYEASYYAKLKTIVNDDHGTGIILALLSEYYQFL